MWFKMGAFERGEEWQFLWGFGREFGAVKG